MYIYGGVSNPHKIFEDKLKLVLNEQNLQKRAAESRFYKRSGATLSPKRFLDMLLDGISEQGYFTLNKSAIEFGIHNNMSVSKQAIHSRYNNEAVDFIRQLLGDVLASQVSQSLASGFLKDFNKLILKDATRFDLPPQLSPYFKGFGGSCTSDSAISIQYEFDLKNLAFKSLEFTSAKVPDVSKANIVPGQFNKNDLVIRDLGYFKRESFKELMTSEAFFISRLNTTAKVYIEDSAICFKDLYYQMQRTSSTCKDLKVLLNCGKDEKIQVRLVAQLVTEEMYRKRLATLEKNAKRKGLKISEESRRRCRFFLIITNIESEKMSMDELFSIYRLRWQIELMFKLWKSVLGIHKVQKMKLERFLCMLYAKLIYITFSIETISLARSWLYKKKKEILSVGKCFNTLIEKKRILSVIRTIWTKRKDNLIRNIFKIFENKHWLERRKNNKNFEDIFDSFHCISGDYDYIYEKVTGEFIAETAC